MSCRQRSYHAIHSTAQRIESYSLDRCDTALQLPRFMIRTVGVFGSESSLSLEVTAWSTALGVVA